MGNSKPALRISAWGTKGDAFALLPSSFCGAGRIGENGPQGIARREYVFQRVGCIIPAVKPATREMVEGTEAFTRFDTAIKSLLSVPRSELQRREAEYKAKAALNPRKRGPRPKQKSVSRDRSA